MIVDQYGWTPLALVQKIIDADDYDQYEYPPGEEQTWHALLKLMKEQ